MKFEDHAALTGHTIRLRSATHAITLCNQSLNEQEQVFDYAGARFTGPDAVTLKQALMNALGGIANESQLALVKGGIVFPDAPNTPAPAKAATPNRAARRKAKVGK